MRFIGPRPEVKQYFSKKNFKFLNNVKAWDIRFRINNSRNESLILEKIGGENPYEQLLPIKLELADYYSKNKSFWLDLKLVVITTISIFPQICFKNTCHTINKGKN